MANRFHFGPRGNASVVATALVAVVLGQPYSSGDYEVVPVTVPAYDPKKLVRLVKVHAVYSAAAPADGVSPEEFMAAAGNFAGSAECPAGTEAADLALSISVASVPPGDWEVITILETE